MLSRESFVIHKPANALCSTVDAEKPAGSDRLTIYEVAAQKGFPTHFSLVGRLDLDTSGIMLFTTNHELFMEINTPIAIDSEEGSGSDSTVEDAAVQGLYEYKTKVYRVTLLGGAGIVAKLKAGEKLEKEVLEREFARPFTFSRQGVQREVREFHSVNVTAIYQDERLSRGRAELGWCVDVELTILEGKHHQIRRMAKRNKFIVVSLHRQRIAGILSVDERIAQPGDCRWLTKEEERLILHNIDALRKYLRRNNTYDG